MAEGSTINPFGSGSGYTPDLLAQFLSRVVPWATQSPPEGYVNLHAWTPKGQAQGRKFPRSGGGRAFASMEEYGDILQFVSRINRDGDEVFICMSSRDGYTPRTMANGQVVRHASRSTKRAPKNDPHAVLTKAVGLKALWLDLDVKPGAYASKQAALAALLPFCDDLGLTPGFIVDSGVGIHVYFVLDQPVTPDVWAPLAGSLLAAAKAKGLKADTAVSEDNRLMRLPTSFNRKDHANPSLCRVLKAGPDMTLAQVRAALAPYPPPTPEVRPATMAGRPLLDPAIFPQRQPITRGADYVRVQADLDHVRIVTSVDLLRSSCPVVADSEARGGDGDREPLWFELAKLCHYVQNGRDYFHTLSRGDERYDQSATDLKFDLVQKDGWPNCKTIEQSSPAAAAICKRCAFYNNTQVSERPSPIHYATRSLPGTVAAAMPTQATVAPLPAQMNGHAPVNAFLTPGVPGSRAFDPVFLSRLAATGHTLDPQDYILTPDNKPLFKTKVWDIVCGWETARSNLRVLRVNVTIPTGSQTNEDKVVTFLAGEISSPSGITSVRNQGLTFDPKNLGAVVNLMDSWTTIVRRQMAAHSETRLGWVENNGVIVGFAYAGFIFDKHGKQVSSIASANDDLTPRGNLADWRRAANYFMGKGCVEMEVMIATAFAAPLVALSNVEGVIVFARADTGYGKTASLESSASVWGSRSQIPTSATSNYIDAEIAKKHNLPIYYDEIVTGPKHQSKLGELVLRIASGIERGRNDRTAVQNAVRVSRTMLVAAANHSLTELASTKDTSAQAARVFELEMSDAIKRIGMRQSDVGEVKKMLEANYGQAGLVYAEFLGKHHAVVQDMVTETIHRFETKLNLGQAERYWLAAAATLLVGATISKQLGLIDFDIMSMEKFLFDQLRRQHATVKSMAIDASDPEVQLTRVRDFVNSNLQQRLITATMPPHGWNKSQLISIMNREEAEHAREIVMRLATQEAPPLMLLSDRALKAYCDKEQISYSRLYATLSKAGLCVKSRRLRSLGAGTSKTTTREIVIEFDLSLPPNAPFLPDGV